MNENADPTKEGKIAIDAIIAAMVETEVSRQIPVLKEKISDIIGAQFDALKVDEVSQVVAEAKAAANMETMKEIQRKYNVGYKYTEINELIDGLEDIKKEINSKRTILRTVHQSLSDVELTVKESEAGLLADIIAETLPESGKPRFSNDKARQAELVARKKTDENYIAAANQYRAVREQLESLGDEMSSLDIDLKKIEMQFQIECRTLDAMTAEMNIYAATLGAGGKVVNNSYSVYGGDGVKGIKSPENKDKGVW